MVTCDSTQVAHVDDRAEALGFGQAYQNFRGCARFFRVIEMKEFIEVLFVSPGTKEHILRCTCSQDLSNPLVIFYCRSGWISERHRLAHLLHLKVEIDHSPLLPPTTNLSSPAVRPALNGSIPFFMTLEPQVWSSVS